MGPSRKVQRFGGERVVVELVEIAPVGEFLVGPNTLDAFDEFSAASRKEALALQICIQGGYLPVALCMFEPPLSYAGEFCFEPSRNDVNRDSSLCIMIDAGNLFSSNGWVPWPGKESSDDIQFLGSM